MQKFIMLCLCPTSLTVLAAGVVRGIPNYELGKYFQFKKGVFDCFLTKKSLMTAMNFIDPVHTKVTV